MYQAERLAANHARGHNLIHPEVAGGPRDVRNPKAFSVFQNSVWGDFLFVILFFVPPASNRCLGQRLE